MNYNKDKRFSVIVPTMWMSPILFEKSLNHMVLSDFVDEIIIIDNDIKNTPNWEILNNNKVRILSQEHNIKVNPAWNLGVEKSKNQLVAIINDDLFFDNKLFEKIINHINSDIGVYGFIVGGKKYNQPEITDGSINFIKWDQSVCAYGFGQIIIMDKKNWMPIIHGLDIYFGDEFIFHNIYKKKLDIYLISNMIYEEDFGRTSSQLGIAEQYFNKEKPIYEEWIMNYKTKKRILIAVPTMKYIEPETFKSIYDLSIPDDVETKFEVFIGNRIDKLRNTIANEAKKYDYVFYVDSDIIFSNDVLQKFINADKDVISGMYIQRIENTHTLEVYMDTPNGGVTNIPYDLIKNRGIVEIASCGFGCVLIKSSIFENMDYPYFEYHPALDHKNTVSEDVDFCLKARKKGFTIWTDSNVLCDHKGNMLYKVDTEFKSKQQDTKKIEIEKTQEYKPKKAIVASETYRDKRIFK